MAEEHIQDDQKNQPSKYTKTIIIKLKKVSILLSKIN